MFKRLILIAAVFALAIAMPELWSAKQLRAEDAMIVSASSQTAKAAMGKAMQKADAPKALLINVDHGYPLLLKSSAASVFIANPDIADIQVMSPTSIMIFGKRTGDTTFMATDAAGTTLERLTIRVVQDLTNLRNEINNIVPGHKVRVESVPNGIVLAGVAKDAATVADVFKLAQRYLPASGGDIINRIRVGGSNQVQIRVRFAEVARNVDNSMGFNWQSIGQLSGFTFGIATGVSALAGASSVISTRPNNTALSLPNNVIGLSHKFGSSLSVDGLIDALAQDGLITILAEPNLTAMSGETANFLAGGEFPVPIPQGNGTISITFKSYGISLAFTPTLIGENRINLHVKPEVSQLTTNGSIVESNITVPAISTRRAETTVEVASGQSFAIAGLLDNNQTQTINKYPLLGDLPIIGALFRSTRFQNGQTELVIIITPYIVRPSGEKLALPTDGYSPPTEEERLMDMRYSAADPDAHAMSGSPIAVRDSVPAPDSLTAAPVTPVAAPPPTTQPPATQHKPHAKRRHKPSSPKPANAEQLAPQPVESSPPPALSQGEGTPPLAVPAKEAGSAEKSLTPSAGTAAPGSAAPAESPGLPTLSGNSGTATPAATGSAPVVSSPAPEVSLSEKQNAAATPAHNPVHKKKSPSKPKENSQPGPSPAPKSGDHSGAGGFILE